jgi:hypothetical protein
VEKHLWLKWDACKPDAEFENYKFRNAAVLPVLRLHYATLGEPHRDAQNEQWSFVAPWLLTSPNA